jgi:hypothetical protein
MAGTVPTPFRSRNQRDFWQIYEGHPARRTSPVRVSPISRRRRLGTVGRPSNTAMIETLQLDGSRAYAFLGMAHVHEFALTRPDAFADPLRKHAMHHTAKTACRTTAGHIRTPTGLPPAPALARTAPAAQLYNSIAATNPRRARLGPSSRASQQAPPNDSSAAPATRPTTSAAGASSDSPSKNATTSAGDTSSIKPIGVSTNAVAISSVLATISCTNSRRGSFRIR